jgi:hypothetical protein
MMKKTISLLSVIILGILATFIYSCEEDSKETCQQDEICTAKLVTYCCTDSICVYKYDGKEYSEDNQAQLLKDMGCASTAGKLKSADGECSIEEVVARLNALRARVEVLVNSKK